MDEAHSLGAGSIAFRLLAVLLLVLANAFFVAAEFAFVASRRTRIEAMAESGDHRARSARKVSESLDRYISATQFGITLASLGLGWVGEPALAGLIHGLFSWLPRPLDVIATHGIAAGVAFFIIAFLHIVFGELAPKAVALLHPEETSRWLADPLIVFTRATNPFIWLLNGAANVVLRFIGTRSPTARERVHSPEEIMMLIEESRETGGLHAQDARMIEGVFEFSERTAYDVMTPRANLVAMPSDATVEAAADLAAESGRSRYPVYRESLDDIVGTIHIKDLVAALRAGHKSLEPLARAALFIPGTRKVRDVLADMRRTNTHIAIVLDEFGGTAGILTMEDLLEEIVGQIYDEYDERDDDHYGHRSDEAAVLPGGMEIKDFNRRFGAELDDRHYSTIGGLIFGELGRLPRAGDRVIVPGGRFDVEEMDGRRVGTVRFTPTAPGDEKAG